MSHESSPHESSHVTRRRIIRTGAVAAGFVWAAPAVHSVRPLQSNGSPPPTSSSSTTTTLPPGTIRFDGTFTTYSQVGEAQPNCGFGLEVTFGVEMDDFGPAVLVLDVCLIPTGTPEVPLQIVAFTVTTASGDVTGNGFGSITHTPGQPSVLQLQLTATGGTNAFAGASGSLAVDALVDDPAQTVSGTLTGTLVLPV
jgi:hypothetical protein